MKITDLDFILDGELANQIVRRSLRVAAADGVLYRQGDPPDCLYFVASGEIEIKLAAAQEEVRFRAGASSLLGIAAVIGNQPYAMSASVSPGAEVFKIPMEAFEELMTNEPRMRDAVVKILAAEVRAARKALGELASR